LALAVTHAGSRSFYLYKRVHGRPERIHIGGFPDLTVEQARRKAAELCGDIARGENPAGRRRKARGAMTLGELFADYIERAKLDKRTWAEDRRRYDTHLSAWKARKLAEITKADVARLHGKIGADTPYEANRTRALLSVLYSHAAGQFDYEGPNPCRGVKRFREEKRERFLLPDELKRFFAALNADETAPVMRDFYSVALLTGARRGNVQSMRWDELDLGRGTWGIPGSKSKNSKPMVVHLPVKAVEILQARKDANDEKPEAERAGYVFPSYGACGHIVDARQSWTDIIDRAKLPGLRMHDLRRTLASWAAMTGASLHVVGKALGHRDPTATAIYARLTDAPVRDAVNTAAVAMLTAGGLLLPAPAPDTNGKGGGNGAN
jgi:integrase